MLENAGVFRHALSLSLSLKNSVWKTPFGTLRPWVSLLPLYLLHGGRVVGPSAGRGTL